MKKTAIYLFLLCFPITLSAAKNTIKIGDILYEKEFFNTYKKELIETFSNITRSQLTEDECSKRVFFFNKYSNHPKLLSATIDQEGFVSHLNLGRLNENGCIDRYALIRRLVQYAPHALETKLNKLATNNNEKILERIANNLQALSYTDLIHVPTNCVSLRKLAIQALQMKIAKEKSAEIEAGVPKTETTLQAFVIKELVEKLATIPTNDLEKIGETYPLHLYAAEQILEKKLAPYTSTQLETIPTNLQLLRYAAKEILEKRLENASAHDLEQLPKKHILHRFAAVQIIKKRLKLLPIQQLTQIPSTYPTHQQVAIALLEKNMRIEQLSNKDK